MLHLLIDRDRLVVPCRLPNITQSLLPLASLAVPSELHWLSFFNTLFFLELAEMNTYWVIRLQQLFLLFHGFVPLFSAAQEFLSRAVALPTRMLARL